MGPELPQLIAATLREIFGHFRWTFPLRETLITSGIWNLGRLRYVGPLSLQLVLSATWDLCYLSWSVPLRGTNSLRYVHLFQTGPALGHVPALLSDRSSFRART